MAITVLNSVDVKPSPAADPATCPSAPLSPLDRIVPNVNASLLFFLRDRTDKPSLDPTTLKSSLARALAEFPTLAGEIVPKPGQAPTLVASDRGVSFVHARSDTGIDELSQSSWAAAKIPQELFASGPFPQPGQTLLGIQLTEYPDNVYALSFRRRHQVTDLPGFTLFLRRWSAINAHLVQNGSLPDDISASAASLHNGRDPAALAAAVPRTKANAQNGMGSLDAAYRLAADAGDTGMTRAPEPIKGQLFRLDKAALDNLKKQAHEGLEEGQWVSTGDAIGALFWRAIVRARQLDKTQPEKDIKLGVAVNGREKLKKHSPEATEYFGNLVTGVCVSKPALSLSQGLLSEVAYPLRAGLLAQDEGTLSRSMEHLCSLDADSVERLRVAHTDVFGDDASLTSWTSYAFYDAEQYGFGSTEVLKASAGPVVGDGVIVLLPTSPQEGGAIEAMLGLTAAPLERALKDSELLQYALPVSAS